VRVECRTWWWQVQRPALLLDGKTLMIGVRVKYCNNDGHFATKGSGQTHTHSHMHWRRVVFIICPVLYAIAIGQIKKSWSNYDDDVDHVDDHRRGRLQQCWVQDQWSYITLLPIVGALLVIPRRIGVSAVAFSSRLDYVSQCQFTGGRQLSTLYC